MKLTVRITTILLIVLTIVLFGFGVMAVQKGQQVLEQLLDQQGNAIAETVSIFSV
ncbi:MAG: hypothetical protein OQL17_10235 [Sedimenticola sp.]|nr:hypothetical protein [Sedimenticola sp.]